MATLELELGNAQPLPSPSSVSGPLSFSGPFDVLLAIVRRNGYPLDRLPLGEITRQFTAYLEQHREQIEQEELELGSEFFDTASWLVLLKSRALLPSERREAEPAEELRQVLVAREIAQGEVAQWSGWLAEGLDQVGRGSGLVASRQRLAEAAVEGPVSGRDTTLTEKVPTVQDAVMAARRALAVARAHASATAAASAGMAMADVLQALDARLQQLAPGAIVSTAPWFTILDPESASVLLLALLELARIGVLWVYQAAHGTTLWVQKPAELPLQRPDGRQRSRSTGTVKTKKGRAS